MVKKIISLILIFYFLTLFQISFLAHFIILGITPNLVLITVVIINLFRFPQWQKIFAAFIGGIYLDIFSISNPFGFFGFYTFILLIFTFSLRFIFKRYVRFSLV